MISDSRNLLITAAVAFIAGFGANAMYSTIPSAGSKGPVTHGEFNTVLKQALLDNPDILKDALKKIGGGGGAAAKDQPSKKDVEAALQKHKAELLEDKASPSAGNQDSADVTVVEFFDYHCGYCKRMLPIITQLINEDKKVRVVFREFPILSEESTAASRAALAVNSISKGKYFAYHTALMGVNGKFDEPTFEDLAQKEGISATKLKKAEDDNSIVEQLDVNRKIASDLGIRGTPAIIVGDTLMPGAVSYDDLKKAVADARSAAKKG